MDIYVRKKTFPFFRGDLNQYPKSAASTCLICNEPFDDYVEQLSIDLYHCHYCRKFLGWDHEKRNGAQTNVNFTKLVSHNIKNYNLDHIFLDLQSCEPTSTASKIPSIDEKYISTNFGVLVETITLEDGKVKEKNENLRFIDSIETMSSSLKTLVEFVSKDCFGTIASVFPNLFLTGIEAYPAKRILSLFIC